MRYARNISWYRKPLDGDAGGSPSARKLRTTKSQVNPVNTRAKNGRIMRRGFSARTRRLVHVRWAPRESCARRPVLGRAFVLAFPEDLQDEGRLFLVRRRQDGDAFLQLHREESAQEGLRMLERRELGQIPFEDEQGLRIRLSEPLDLLEEAFADERVEEVREGLAFDPDGSQDVIARRDLLDLDRHAELSQSVGNVLRFVRIDDEGNAHGRPIRGTDVNVPVGGRNQPR